MQLHHVLLSALASIVSVSAQQGVLTNGNSQLPACAQQCSPLVQAAQACVATNTATQQNWICFCQSAYLVNLRSSTVGVCDAACTNPTDNQQVSTWYNSNCGSDNGASEHADGGAGTATTTVAANAGGATTAAGGAAAATNSGSSSASNSGNSGADTTTTNQGDWWSNHYQWIIMVIVLAVCLPLIAFGALWLKRRHERKRDYPSTGFNAGITQRAPPMSNSNFNTSGVVAGPSGTAATSGRNSPARTREAFMPYGYGYAHSDGGSRLGSKQVVGEERRARGETPVGEMEKAVGNDSSSASRKKSKKVLVREKSEGSWM